MDHAQVCLFKTLISCVWLCITCAWNLMQLASRGYTQTWRLASSSLSNLYFKHICACCAVGNVNYKLLSCFLSSSKSLKDVQKALEMFRSSNILALSDICDQKGKEKKKRKKMLAGRVSGPFRDLQCCPGLQAGC